MDPAAIEDFVRTARAKGLAEAKAAFDVEAELEEPKARFGAVVVRAGVRHGEQQGHAGAGHDEGDAQGRETPHALDRIQHTGGRKKRSALKTSEVPD